MIFLQYQSTWNMSKLTLFTRLTCLLLMTDLHGMWAIGVGHDYISDSLCWVSAECLRSLNAMLSDYSRKKLALVRKSRCPVFVFSDSLKAGESQRNFCSELIYLWAIDRTGRDLSVLPVRPWPVEPETWLPVSWKLLLGDVTHLV